MKFTASRLSEGNKIFPSEIHVEENGLNVKIPGFLSGKSSFLSYDNISSVSVDTPMIGYSTIHFNAMGTRVSVHGFTKDEVKQIKAAIDEGKARGNVSTINVIHSDSSSSESKKGGFLSNLLSDDESDKAPEKDFWDERRERIEGKVNNISEINISGTADEISQQLSKLFSIAGSKPEKKVKNAIIEKIEFGVMKLRTLGANAEAEFFEKKLEPLKKKGLFG